MSLTLEQYQLYLENKSPSTYLLITKQEYFTHYEGFIRKKMFEGWDINDLFLNQVKDGKLFYVKKMLADYRVDPTFCDHECIVLSVLHRHYPLFELLYQDERIDPSTQGNLPYLLAIQYNDLYFKQKLEQHPKIIQSILGK